MDHLRNDTYTSTIRPQGFFSKIILRQRIKMYQTFMEVFSPDDSTSILDVGVSADSQYLFSNFFEEFYPYKSNITALGLHNSQFLEQRYQGLSFVQGDGRSLPFADQQFDIVFSNAVVEHVGNLEQQEQFIRECLRVVKRGIFLTTPNRFHPIEFHTMLPIIHLLPKFFHRKILSLFGGKNLKELAKEENLNLMTKKELRHILNKLEIIEHKLQDNFFMLFPANIICICYKKLK